MSCPRCSGPSCYDDEMGWCHQCQIDHAYKHEAEFGELPPFCPGFKTCTPEELG